jgi:hypothetical protein
MKKLERLVEPHKVRGTNAWTVLIRGQQSYMKHQNNTRKVEIKHVMCLHINWKEK